MRDATDVAFVSIESIVLIADGAQIFHYNKPIQVTKRNITAPLWVNLC